MKNDFIKPILVLTAICLVVSAALAFTNQQTAPLIEQHETEKAQAAMVEMLPEADSFTEMSASDLPEAVTEAYSSDNNVGYVFMMSTKGYGGEMKLICGIDNDGNITGCKTLSHAETQGLGSKTTEPEFRNQFTGKNSSLEGVDTISGATVSSDAYIIAIEAAFAAFDQIKEA